MSSKVRELLTAAIERILTADETSKALKQEKPHLTRENTILISLTDLKFTIPLSILTRDDAANTQPQYTAYSDPVVEVVSQHHCGKDVLMSCRSLAFPSLSEVCGRDCLLICHVHVCNYPNFVVYLSPSYIQHVVLQIDATAQDMRTYLSMDPNSTWVSSLNCSSLIDSSICSTTSNLASSQGFSDDSSGRKSYMFRPHGVNRNEVKVTKSLIDKMNSYWSGQLASNFRQIYCSVSSCTIWVAVEKNTPPPFSGSDKAFTIDGVKWVFVE